MTDIVARLRKQATCVYLAAEAGPAADLSDGLSKAANEIEKLRAGYREILEGENGNRCVSPFTIARDMLAGIEEH